MACITPAFEKLLPAEGLAGLERASDVVYGVDEDLRVRYANPAWLAFAQENGGDASVQAPGLIGQSLVDVIQGPIAAFYAWNLREVLQSERPWEHRFECSSPELFRIFHMRVSTVGGGRGLLVRNHLTFERAHDPAVRPPFPFAPERYAGCDGLVRECSHCRRVRRRGRDEVWEWVPDLLRRPQPATCQGLCSACFRHYFPSRAPS